ncbi:MAG: hypothetical protein ACREWG_15965 [Gammaproteobacteria bacterium]
MTRLVTLTLLLAVAVVIWQFGPALLPDSIPSSAVPERWKSDLVDRADPSTGYVLTYGRKLSFTVPSGTPLIKLVSNANLRDFAAAKREHGANPARRWKYALHVEIRGAANRLFSRRTYHYRSDFTETLDASGRSYTSVFYLREPDTPLNGRSTALELSGIEGDADLSVRLEALDAALSSVLLRVYLPARTDERRLAHLWGHISDKQKVTLARGSIYPPELLREEEKRNLLRHRRQPLGPAGLAGLDFESRTLYVLEEKEGTEQSDMILPAGVLADRERIAVIPLPEQGGKLRLHLEQTSAPGAESGTVGGRWYGSGPQARRRLDIPWQAPATTYHGEFGGGLLELEAPRELVIRAYLSAEGGETEITPSPTLLRGYSVSAARPVEYAITHLGEDATPFKADFRQVLAPAPVAVPITVAYTLLSEREVTIKAGRFSIAATPSRYDWVIGDLPGLRLSDPVTYYFALPRAVAKVRFRVLGALADTRLFVFGATSPPDWVRTVRIPEQQFDFDARQKRQLAWFPLRPEGYERFMLDNTSRPMALQPRPAQEDPLIQSGQYQWSDYLPNGPWHGRQALLPRDPGLPYREEALPSTYAELPRGREVLLDFPTYRGLEALAPGLVWLADRNLPDDIKVYVDGRLHLAARVRGGAGELRLPHLAAGRHRLRVEGPGRYFVNHVGGDAGRQVKRLLVRLAEPLSYWHERTTTEAENLTLRFFPTMTVGRSVLRFRIEGGAGDPLGPEPGWLFRDRRFDLRHDPDLAAPLFESPGERIGRGQRIAIALPQGLSRGHYRIRLALESGPPAYVALSKLTPGRAAASYIAEEPVHVGTEPE